MPQGLSISNILSSLYLSDIDEQLGAIPGTDYFRFVDDILMAGSPVIINQLAKSTPKLLRRKRKLECHEFGEESKSVILPIGEGIEYLGYRFCRENIEVRKASFKKMFANIMKLVSAMKYSNNKSPLIWRLNLRISGCQYLGRRVGWVFFFSQSKNTRQMKQLDAFVERQAGRVLSGGDLARIKRFVKAYHEIRFRCDETRYFPNFDSFDDEQKKQEIGVLFSSKSRAELDLMSSTEIDVLFRKCISREIADLEKDMLEVFS